MGIRKAELNDGRIVAVVAFLCSLAVLVAASLATLALATGASEMLRTPFLLMCHGQIERAFSIAGVGMPLCARCCGVYAGMALAALVMFVAAPVRRTKTLFILGAGLVIPMTIDGTFQTLGLWSTGNIPRAATGVAFGIGLVILAINGIAGREVEAAGKQLSI